MRIPSPFDALIGFGAVLSLLFGGAEAQAQSAEEFYAKNGPKVLVGTAPGGSYDLMGRLTARHISRHLPGNHTIVVQNMPGGGSLIASNHLYNIAPQDGSVLGAVVPGIILTALFKEKSVRYDPAKFHWIGNVMDTVPVPTLFHTAPVKSLEDLKTKEAIMGAGGISSMDATNALLMNALLGTKIKLVQGYKGGDAINLAMERGEVHGRGSQAWAAWKAIKPDWLAEGKLIPLMQLALAPLGDPKLKGVPLLVDLVKDEGDRKIARVYSSVAVLGRPMVFGPGVPEDRVAFMRKAYAAMAADREFLADAEKQRIDIKYLPGTDIQAMIDEVRTLDTRQAARLKAIVQPPKAKKSKN